MVVVPEAKVVARPALTGALAMVATVGTVELQWELIETSCVEPSLKVPVAVICCLEPTVTAELAGVMAMETRVPVPMVTVVVPVTPEEVAETVSVPDFLAWRMPLLRRFAKLFFEECQETLDKMEVLPSL